MSTAKGSARQHTVEIEEAGLGAPPLSTGRNRCSRPSDPDGFEDLRRALAEVAKAGGFHNPALRRLLSVQRELDVGPSSLVKSITHAREEATSASGHPKLTRGDRVSRSSDIEFERSLRITATILEAFGHLFVAKVYRALCQLTNGARGKWQITVRKISIHAGISKMATRMALSALVRLNMLRRVGNASYVSLPNGAVEKRRVADTFQVLAFVTAAVVPAFTKAAALSGIRRDHHLILAPTRQRSSGTRSSHPAESAPLVLHALPPFAKLLATDRVVAAREHFLRGRSALWAQIFDATRQLLGSAGQSVSLRAIAHHARANYSTVRRVCAAMRDQGILQEFPAYGTEYAGQGAIAKFRRLVAPTWRQVIEANAIFSAMANRCVAGLTTMKRALLDARDLIGLKKATASIRTKRSESTDEYLQRIKLKNPRAEGCPAQYRTTENKQRLRRDHTALRDIAVSVMRKRIEGYEKTAKLYLAAKRKEAREAAKTEKIAAQGRQYDQYELALDANVFETARRLSLADLAPGQQIDEIKVCEKAAELSLIATLPDASTKHHSPAESQIGRSRIARKAMEAADRLRLEGRTHDRQMRSIKAIADRGAPSAHYFSRVSECPISKTSKLAWEAPCDADSRR